MMAKTQLMMIWMIEVAMVMVIVSPMLLALGLLTVVALMHLVAVHINSWSSPPLEPPEPQTLNPETPNPSTHGNLSLRSSFEAAGQSARAECQSK